MIFGPLSTTRYTIKGVDVDMVRLPPGRLMDGEKEHRKEVLVPQGFELCVTLVTQTLWQAVMESNPSKFKGKDQHRPVDQVSSDDIQAFLTRLEELGFTGFRLPTNAEWAWAARCGAPTRWPGGDRGKTVSVSDAERPAPVTSRKPSATGIFDLSGNLVELTSDPYQRINEPLDSALYRFRTSRGGGWSDFSDSTRTLLPHIWNKTERYDDAGLRLARTYT
jgi:formylglycine-generating enzyme required for sulfatase activity